MDGNLSEFSVADLLQLYQIAVKTGTIEVQAGERRHTLYLDRGHVSGVGAEGWELVTELRRIEWLTPEVRQQLDLMEDGGGYVGLSLIARALLTPRRWDQFVELQIEELIYPILSLTEGTFIAEVDVIPRVAPLRINQPPQQIILNHSRWEADMRAAAQEGFGGQGVWRRTRLPDTDDDLLLHLLNRPRRLDDLAPAAGLSRLQVTDRMRRLRALGAVVPASAPFGARLATP